MEQTYLPGKIRDRIQDLMKSRKVTQAELATRIGCSESSLSRFISGKTDKLGDENIIRITVMYETIFNLFSQRESLARRRDFLQTRPMSDKLEV